MSKLSYEHTDLIGLCRIVDEAGPITAIDMVGDFMPLVKRGFVGSDGLLTTKGKEFLAQEDAKP